MMRTIVVEAISTEDKTILPSNRWVIIKISLEATIRDIKDIETRTRTSIMGVIKVQNYCTSKLYLLASLLNI